jgi:hypothetical protein
VCQRQDLKTRCRDLDDYSDPLHHHTYFDHVAYLVEATMDLPHAGASLAVVLLDRSVAVVDVEHGQRHGVATIGIHEVDVGCSDDKALTATIVRALDLPHDLPTELIHSFSLDNVEQGSR